MRTAAEVEEYKQSVQHMYVNSCKVCKGSGESTCRCQKRCEIAVAAYEACVPRDFWGVKKSDVTHNKDVFQTIILKYVERLNKALRHGYGLVLLGDNGVGKTFFISYVLMSAIKAGRTAYYTTMPQLDYDIKRGFKDTDVDTRLRWMLTSDFLAIDEMGKEKYKNSAGYTDVQVERILKQRCDDSMPVLLATNMDYEAFISSYGPTVGSIIGGKFQPVAMEPGDYRAKTARKMNKDMKYEI